MNVRQKLSLAALCFTIPVMASAQAAAPAPAAEAAPAAAAAPAAPSFEFKAYGFLLLTGIKADGNFSHPEYPGKIANEDASATLFSARQSRIGWTMKNADGGFAGTKALGGKLEFDFMGAATDLTDSVLPRLRYAVANADWAVGPGTLTLTAGQTDGLVNPLHPELGAYVALPTFIYAGNLTRRSPQLRVGYAADFGMVGVTVEAAALTSIDKGAGSDAYYKYGSTKINAGAAAGPDIEARVQAVVKPMADVKATLGFGYHTNKQTYEAGTAGEKDLTSTLMGVDVNVDATKYLTIRGEWFTGKGSDEGQTGAFAATTGAGTTRELNESTGYWVQATIKPIPQVWVIAGLGSTTSDNNTTTDTTYSMMNLGVIAPVSKNWRLGLEYTTSKAEAGTVDLSGSEIALSSRFSF